MPFLVYYVVHDVTRILMMFLLQYISAHSTGAYSVIKTHDAVFSGIISMLDMLIGAFVLLILMRHDKEELSVWDYVNLNGISFYRKDRIHPAPFGWILIMIQALCMSLGLNVLISMSGLMRFSTYEDKVQAQYSIPLWFGIILYGVVSPAVEELLFRTIFYGRMKRRFSLIISVIISSMFFGLYHGNVIQGIYGFFMGILMCLACEYLHTVAGAFLVHSLANLTIYLTGMAGVLVKLNSPVFCVIFLGAGAVTLIIEMYYSKQSENKLGHIEGILPVGLFYVDPTLMEEDEDGK